MLDHSANPGRHALSVRKDDLYETPEVATRALLSVEKFSGTIWEPACGPGAIVRVLREEGHRVYATDLVDYECPDSESRIDFLMEQAPGIELHVLRVVRLGSVAPWPDRVAPAVVGSSMSWNSQLSTDERRSRAKRWRRPSVTQGGNFYDTGVWSYLRNRTLMRYGSCCQRCQTTGDSSNPIQVDHIKPRSKYPELELDPNNLQVLCQRCNKAKGNWDETDWRSI